MEETGSSATPPEQDGQQPSPECDGRIPQEELNRAHRRLCRRIAAVLIRTMADTDTDLETIAARLDQPISQVRGHLRLLVDGKSRRDTLDFIAVFAFAMGGEFEFSITRREALAAEGQSK